MRTKGKKERIIVFGVDIGEFLEVVRGESVLQRFMREESVIERILEGPLESTGGDKASL